MKIVQGFIRVLFTAQIIIQALLYAAIILIQIFYPAASWLQMIFAAAFLLIIQAIFIFTGSQGETKIIDEKSESDEV